MGATRFDARDALLLGFYLGALLAFAGAELIDVAKVNNWSTRRMLLTSVLLIALPAGLIGAVADHFLNR
jgi:hypothetical protein